MNFSIHLDDATLQRLAAAVERMEVPRNRLIAQAVREWLDRNEEPEWPAALQAHFRNPAPELATETLDLLAWREALGAPGQTPW